MFLFLKIYLFNLVLLPCVYSESVFYHTFTGNELSQEEVKEEIKKNTTFWCVIEVAPCDPSEGRRLDGSCNNLQHPNQGTIHTPFHRLLPAKYGKDFDPRTSKCGEPLPLSRVVRTGVLAEGRVPDTSFTQLMTHFWVYAASDFVSLQDTVNYVEWKPYCCKERGKKDRECIQIAVPNNDPVHRFSSLRCMNLTRPFSYQSVGCLPNNTTAERIVSATPTFDLALIYGSSLKDLNEKARLLERGLLKTEEENDKIWPPSIESERNICLMNQLPHETRCHDTPNPGTNSILGGNLFTTWMWRLHNRIATVLAEINPCWSDDKLFFTAKDIVISINTQLLYYELMPALMGYENLVEEGVITPYEGFRDIYDENVEPRVLLEFPLVQRWGHTMQEGKLKMYDEHGYYMKEIPIVNMTLRTGYLVDNLEYITQGAFRQPSAKYDYIVDPYMAETALGNLQDLSDVFSSDLTKNRYFGLPPYIEYRKLCSGKTYKTFDDLLDVIDPERIQLLKEIHKHVEDVDLMTGIWLERPVEGGNVPVTFYCITVDQLIRTAVSDRHWYERPNRPHAFTLEQLLEVRKTSIAQILCAVGDSVTEIQPNAFYLPGKGNEIRSCKKIQKMNFLPWKDRKCKRTNDCNLRRNHRNCEI